MSDRLGLPLQVTKHYTTLDEFVKWQAYIHRCKTTEREKIDWQFAQLNCTITNALGGAKSKVEDHLLRFSDGSDYNPDASKNVWFAALGINP